MKKINDLFESYKESILKIESEKLKKHEELKSKIRISKSYLQQLRDELRGTTFDSIDKEILFFKKIKPQIRGELNFFRRQLVYIQEKPNFSIDIQREYIQKELKRLEVKKKKNFFFYRYLKQEETAFDELYFTRGREQLELFSLSDYIDTDIKFTTSHDLLACEVVTYDLLTEFYKQELHCLSNLEAGLYETTSNSNFHNTLTWSASKTDLIELVYSLKLSGAINNGEINIKQLIEIFGSLFGLELGNFYKTYGEIRNRNKDHTKFLSKLSLNLTNKIDMEVF